MNFDRLIRKDHPNSYCVVFPNFRAFNDHEIYRAFSQFGRVKSVTTSGDERGYRFVRYWTYEEAKRAVEGLRHNSEIRLCPPHHRNMPNREQSRHHQHQQEFKRGGKKSSGSSDLVERLSKARLNSQATAAAELSDSASVSSNNSSGGGWSSGIETDRSNSSNDRRPRKQEASRNDSMTNLPLADDDGRDIEQQQPKSIIVPKEERATQGSDRYFDIQNLKLEKPSDELHEEPVPNLVKKDSRSASEKIVLNASEVVVGNIPSNFGAAYLLHLLEKFEPLAISDVMIIPNTNTRYCHVYFKKNQDAAEVERCFDNYQLLGKHLVVLRPSSLMLLSGINKQMCQ